MVEGATSNQYDFAIPKPFDPLLQKRSSSTTTPSRTYSYDDDASSYVSVPLLINDRTMTVTGTLAPSSTAANDDDMDNHKNDMWWRKDMDDDEIDVTAIEMFCTKLTLRERLLGCAICNLGGYVLSFGSLVRFGRLIRGNPMPFVTTWTLGHFLSLLGSTFLVGPKRQFQQMFHPTRCNAAAAYLASMFITLVIIMLCSVLNRPTGLAMGFILILLMAVQYLCVLWYTLSYIPFARDALKKMIFGRSGDGSSLNERGSTGAVGWVGSFRRKYEYDEII